jgi:hypothetical protein
MIINVRVSPRSSRALVQEANGAYRVYLTKPAVDGAANLQLVELLSGYFKVKKYNVRIIRGETSRNKTVEIDK